MSKLIVRSTIPSSINVSGFTVYNIRSENSTFIVEVEGTSNTAPSVGDIITFGNYPQATSTPEPIEWKVLEVDTTNHKCLLIANKVLDCQKYNSENTNVTWEICSLRTWCNNTFLNAAFSTYEQSRILTTTIQNPNNPTFGTSGGNPTNDKVFCLSLQEASNTEYFANSNSRKSISTQKAINGGASQVSGYTAWWLRTPGSNSTVACIVRYDGDFNNSGIIVENTTVGIRPALWMYYSQTVRFKAFKYTFNGISYYYVIDGIHNVWVNDLSSIGYSEVPAVTLPTVTVLPTVGLSGQVQSVAANENTGGLREWDSSSGDYNGNYIEFDNGSKYASIEYASGGGGWSSPVGIFEPTSVTVSGTDVVGAKNVSGTSKNFGAIKIARCLSSTATVVIVYNSSNDSFNAFKFTANNTDYYYVLDKTQTDWTNDLASIGYSLTPSVVLPTVMFSDDISSGTVSLLTLPTEHSGYYTDAKFGSLRYYVKGTVSDPEYFYGLYGISSGWYGGKITWFDSSIGDLSDKLFTTGTPDAGTSGVQQTILRVHLITNGSIGGYSVWDTINNSFIGQISNYTYNNGQHSITLWFKNIGRDWTTFDGAGRLMLRYLDGTTAFNNLDSFNLFNVSSGTLSKATTTDRYDMYNVWNDSVTLNARYASCSGQGVTTVTVYNSSNVAYNAFKYTASGTDYYYVLDGTQTDWTDDLSSIGYHFTISYLKVNKSRMTVGVGESYPLYNASGAQIEYDSTKTYTAVKYYTGSGDLVGTSALGITIGYISGWSYLMLTNNTDSAIQIQRIEYTVS